MKVFRSASRLPPPVFSGLFLFPENSKSLASPAQSTSLDTRMYIYITYAIYMAPPLAGFEQTIYASTTTSSIQDTSRPPVVRPAQIYDPYLRC